MKTVILACGLGSPLGEGPAVRSKPMAEIGGRRIIWNIIEIYSNRRLNDVIIFGGYKGYMINDFFANYFLHASDVESDLAKNSLAVHQKFSEPWRITLVDTGADTMTGGRPKATSSYLDGEDAYCSTYGDGVADLDITALIAFHGAHGRRPAVPPPAASGCWRSRAI